MTGKKVEDLLLNMCSTLQSNSYNNIPKCVMDCCTFIPANALKQMGRNPKKNSFAMSQFDWPIAKIN
jgi:hypothetical protein